MFRSLYYCAFIVLIFVSACTMPPQVAKPTGREAGAAKPEHSYLQAKPADMDWFKDAKFGLFIHWGPVSIKGTEIGWSRGAERRGRGGEGHHPPPISMIICTRSLTRSASTRTNGSQSPRPPA